MGALVGVGLSRVVVFTNNRLQERTSARESVGCRPASRGALREREMWRCTTDDGVWSGRGMQWGCLQSRLTTRCNEQVVWWWCGVLPQAVPSEVIIPNNGGIKISRAPRAFVIFWPDGAIATHPKSPTQERTMHTAQRRHMVPPRDPRQRMHTDSAQQRSSRR